MTAAILVFFGMVACLTTGLVSGYFYGRKQTMTKKEAASILAKASWKVRDRAPTGSFVRFTR